MADKTTTMLSHTSGLKAARTCVQPPNPQLLLTATDEMPFVYSSSSLLLQYQVQPLVRALLFVKRVIRGPFGSLETNSRAVPSSKESRNVIGGTVTRLRAERSRN